MALVIWGEHCRLINWLWRGQQLWLDHPRVPTRGVPHVPHAAARAGREHSCSFWRQRSWCCQSKWGQVQSSNLATQQSSSSHLNLKDPQGVLVQVPWSTSSNSFENSFACSFSPSYFIFFPGTPWADATILIYSQTSNFTPAVVSLAFCYILTKKCQLRTQLFALLKRFAQCSKFPMCTVLLIKFAFSLHLSQGFGW